MSEIILAIETSCDETSVAVVRNGREVLSDAIYSQIDVHTQYGGVVPEIASRKHIEKLPFMVEEALGQAGITQNELTQIAVTYGPGLIGALLVGVSYAKAMAYTLNIPLIPVHHIHGHIAANYIAHPELEPPFVCLVASGGHSHLVYVADYTDFEILGRTRDDAAGEAFDKIARVMGLGYPGGPLIDKLASEGHNNIEFPRVHFKDGTLDFSFSGVKTAVINYLHKCDQSGLEYNKADVANSFQNAVTDILTENLIKAAKIKGSDKIAIAGGVAANGCLRRKIIAEAEQNGLKLYYPPGVLCTDNGAMIGCAGYYAGKTQKYAELTLNATANLPIDIYNVQKR